MHAPGLLVALDSGWQGLVGLALPLLPGSQANVHERGRLGLRQAGRLSSRADLRGRGVA